jgi:hypothetical protein
MRDAACHLKRYASGLPIRGQTARGWDCSTSHANACQTLPLHLHLQSKADDVGTLVNVGVICFLKQLLDTGFFHVSGGIGWWQQGIPVSTENTHQPRTDRQPTFSLPLLLTSHIALPPDPAMQPLHCPTG